jgi:hypothetical protein
MIGGNILKYVCLVQLLELDESGRKWSKILSRPRFAPPYWGNLEEREDRLLKF